MQFSHRLHRVDGNHADEDKAHAMFLEQAQLRTGGGGWFWLQSGVFDEHIRADALGGSEHGDRQPHLHARPPFTDGDFDQLLTNRRVLRIGMPVHEHLRLQRRGVANLLQVKRADGDLRVGGNQRKQGDDEAGSGFHARIKRRCRKRSHQKRRPLTVRSLPTARSASALPLHFAPRSCSGACCGV